MILLAILVACTDPVPVALATCQAVPGLATDEAGITLLSDKLATTELEVLRGAEPTLGLQKVGSAGLATLREQTTCTLVERNDAGGGRWQILLDRTQPEVKTDGTMGDPVTLRLDWQVVAEPDGARVEAGVLRAAKMRARLPEAEAQNDLKRVAGLWKAMAEAVPDPVLVYDIEAAEQRATTDWVLHQLKVKFDHVETGEPDVVVAAVHNASDNEVKKAEITFTFDMDGAVVVEVAETGAIPAKGDGEARLPVPEGVYGTVKVAARSVTVF